MKSKIFKYSTTVAAALSLVAISTNAFALPAYAKKYQENCSFCHTVWPQLNRWGEDFKLNGYQAPKTSDGATKEKKALGDNTFLDIGNANLPLSLRLRVETHLMREKKSDASGAMNQQKGFLNNERSEMGLFASGSLNENVGYFVEGLGADQGFITINKLGGMDFANIEVGISNLNQHGAVTAHRNTLGTPNIVTFKALSSTQTNLLRKNGDAPTIQIFGNPGSGPLSYSLGVMSEASSNDDTAVGFMIRFDHRPLNLAFSYNYVGGISHEAFDNTTSPCSSPASGSCNDSDAYNTHLISGKYDGGELPVYTRFWLGMSDEDNYAFASSSKVKLNRIGYGFDAWYVAQKFEVGLGVDLASAKSDKTGLWIDSNSNSKDKLEYFRFALEGVYLLADNARIGLRYQTGGLDKEYLKARNTPKDDALILKIDIAI